MRSVVSVPNGSDTMEVEPRVGPTDWNRQRARMKARQAEAMEMRKSLLSYREIARALGVNVKTAYNYVQDAIAELMPREDVEEVRDLEADRLDTLERAVIEILGHPDVRVADRLTAVTRAQGLMERRAKLLGLDMPTQVNVSGEVTVETTTDRELRSLVEEMRPDLAVQRPDLA